jgi:hypothetical protein
MKTFIAHLWLVSNECARFEIQAETEEEAEKIAIDCDCDGTDPEGNELDYKFVDCESGEISVEEKKSKPFFPILKNLGLVKEEEYP